MKQEIRARSIGEVVDFFKTEHPDERVMAAHWLGKKLFIFTPGNIYVARRYRWYERLFDRIFRGMRP